MMMDLEDFCGNQTFFDPLALLNSSSPDFSPCFEHTVFDLTPCALMLIFSIPYYLIYRHSSHPSLKPSRLFITRMTCNVLLFLLAIANFAEGIWEYSHDNQLGLVLILSPAVLALGMAKAILFLNFDRNRGIKTSGLLTCFWLLYLVLWLFLFYSHVQRLLDDKPLSEGELFRCITFFMSYSCVIALFIMCFFIDNPPATLPQDPFSDETDLLKSDEELQEEIMSKLKPCPEQFSTFLSKLFFHWFSSMIILGYKRSLIDEDLWNLNKQDHAVKLSEYFMKKWDREKEEYEKRKTSRNISAHTWFEDSDDDPLIEQPAAKKKDHPSLFRALIKSFGPFYITSSFLKVSSDVLGFVSPQILKEMITFTTSSDPIWHGYALAVLLFVAAVFQSILLQQYFLICFTTGMRIRSSVVAAVYRKALLLSSAARKHSTVGEVVNLMSVDAQRLMDLMPFLNIIWSGPFQIILAMYFLWQTMGASTLAGLGLMVLLIPVNGVIASKAHKLQTLQMKYKDERIKLMNEILNGIKVLKMYAWELSFEDKITAIREKELKVLRTTLYLNAAVSFTWTCAPFLVSLITFATYVLSSSHHVLTAEKAFVSLSLFNILQFPLIALPVMISALVQAAVSLKRLQTFLNSDELDQHNVDRTLGPGDAITVHDGTFSWDKDEEPVLKRIHMSVKRGSLVAIVGQVGSGKSSLISSLLGDLKKDHGYVSVKGSVAYVAQQAWIQNLTVRDNVLFGKPLNERKYQRAIKACELKEDLEILPGGDQTEIGERGINLSGGQKQRVSIARAVYQDAEIYLFDDPLSAVDAHVGKRIFDNVLGPKGCLKSKTRLLVTHGVSFLPEVDNIIVLVHGRISEVGSYGELLEKNGHFAEFLKHYAAAPEDETLEEETFSALNSPTRRSVVDGDFEEIRKGSIGDSARKLSRLSSSTSLANGSFHKRASLKSISINADQEEQEMIQDHLMTVERAQTGNIKFSVISSYMKAIGLWPCFIIMTAYICSNSASVGSNIWLAEWSTDPVNPDRTQNETSYRLAVYGVLGGTQAIFVLISSFALSFGSIMASGFLHSKMLQSILKAPMSFFDTTPLGRIVNRFSKDIYLIDEVIPQSLNSFFITFFLTVSTFIVVIYSTPIFGAVIVPILVLYWFVQRFYVRTSRQLKRLESISRSPIYSHFGETLSGVSTIRAYRLQNSFIKQNENKIDTNQMAYYPSIVSNRWLAVRLQVIGNLIVLFAAIFAVVEKGNINAGIVGLSISYATKVTVILSTMVRSASDIETNIVSVERVDEYTAIEQEAALDSEQYRPTDVWPEYGGINFNNYSTRYRDELDLVVHNISVDIKGGEKVGVAGRTGAGKSSLTLALFRIIEAAQGSITIDGLSIEKMGLHSLRSKLSIIPQDPVLFSGTLRMNLDPFGTYPDSDIWDALKHSHLEEFVSSLPKKLEHDVAEGGDNLSVGQRQLVCLARALLRKSKILILDEATAAVDLETDDLIQATIRDRFAGSTTVTIAHRLNTIMDSTRVLVLDSGKVAEYDSPENLLKAKGLFYSMAKDAGLVT